MATKQKSKIKAAASGALVDSKSLIQDGFDVMGVVPNKQGVSFVNPVAPQESGANTSGMTPSPGATGSVAASGVQAASGAGGSGSRSSPIATRANPIEQAMGNLPSISGTPEEQTAQSRTWMQAQGYIDASGNPMSRNRSTGFTSSSGGGGGATATVRSFKDGGIVKESSGTLIRDGLQSMAMGGFVTARGSRKGSKGIQGKRMPKKGVMR